MEHAEILAIAGNGPDLKKFTAQTVTSYKSIAKRLHINACMALYHALQHRECSHINALLNGMRINDATALRRWVGTHTLTPGETERNPSAEAKTLIGYSKDKGFFVRKGLKSEDAWELAELLELDPFYNKDVAEKKAITLEAILDMLAGVKKRADKQADDNDVILPADITTILEDLGKKAAAHKAVIANDNADNKESAKSNLA